MRISPINIEKLLIMRIILTIKQSKVLIQVDVKIQLGRAANPYDCLWPTAAVIPVFISGRPIIKKWADHSTVNIPTVILKDIQQLWEC